MLGIDQIDTSVFWLWFLAYIRITGVLTALPGVGSEQVPLIYRNLAAMVLAIPTALSQIEVPLPTSFIHGGFLLIAEFFVGYVIGAIPMFIIAGLAVSGQVTAGAMGLAQGNMIDPSLGVNVTLVARVKTLVGTVVFLLLDGHHAVLEAALGVGIDPHFGRLTLDTSVGFMLLERLKVAFELAVIVAAPIIVTLLVTQFVLALVTRFVPQVNIFIISLPLTVMVGLFILAYSLPGIAQHTGAEFTSIEALSRATVTGGATP